MGAQVMPLNEQHGCYILPMAGHGGELKLYWDPGTGVDGWLFKHKGTCTHLEHAWRKGFQVLRPAFFVVCIINPSCSFAKSRPA
eukprot:1017684-Pelagomonas_calceolata.AAC.11